MNTRDYCLVSIFISLAVVFRVAKNVVTSMQFVNIPMIFTFLAAILISPSAGFLVGALSFLISDMMIMPGVWTPIDAMFAGLAGFIVGKTFKWAKIDVVKNKWESFTVMFLVLFIVYDFMTSFAFYIVFTGDPYTSATLAILGLFVPVFGGGYIGIGPLTEFTTVTLTMAVYTLVQDLVKKES